MRAVWGKLFADDTICIVSRSLLIVGLTKMVVTIVKFWAAFGRRCERMKKKAETHAELVYYGRTQAPFFTSKSTASYKNSKELYHRPSLTLS